MLDTLKSSSWTDFKKRYKGTFGFLKMSGRGRELVQILDNNKDIVQFSNIYKDTLCAYADKDVIFEFIPLNRGFVNTIYGVRYTTRVPARQWQRGISPTNTEIFILEEGGLSRNSVNLETVNIVVNKCISFKEAFSSWDRNKPVALSKHFAISGNKIFFYSKCVGEFEDPKCSILEPVILQEFRDCVIRNGYNLQVVQK